MAYLLSIETSTKVCSLALHFEGSLVSFSQYLIERSHSSLLTPLIDEVTRHSGIALADLKAIAISEGPGSYTGLRIGTSTAKGLCFGLDLPLITVSTLLSMAYGVNQFNLNRYLLCPMLDARRMEVYTLVTDHNLNVMLETEPKIVGEDSFDAYLDTNDILFFGDGSNKCKPVIKSPNAYFVDNIHPSAKDIGSLAWEKYREKNFTDLATFEPFYLKPFRAGKPKQLI